MADPGPYLQCLDLLEKLHQLIRTDTDESAEGEALRSAMDSLFPQMTSEEVQQLNKISAYLYTIAGVHPEDAYRTAWTQYKSTRDPQRQDDLGRIMDYWQPKIATGPRDPRWTEFAATLPGYHEFWEDGDQAWKIPGVPDGPQS